MPRFLFFAALIWAMSSYHALATPITYEFRGSVAFVGTSIPYGLNVTSGAPVVGGFTYDPASPATSSITDGVSYEQQFTHGFWMNIGKVGEANYLTASTDEYAVQIANNLPQPGGSVSDQFTVLFSSTLSPALTSPLVVDGIDHTAGFLALTFTGNSNLYSDASLPSSIQLSDFPMTLSFFSDTPGGIVDVVFNVTSLTPEPSSAVLLLVGMTAFAYAARRRGVLCRSRK
jgi:hypothetical protein